LATHFHRLAPAALALNLVAVPLSAAVLLCGLGVMVTAGVVPGLAPLAGSAAWFSARALLLSGEVVRNLPWLDVRVPTPTPLACAFYAVSVLLLIDVRCRRRAAPLLALAFVNLIWGRSPVPGDGRFHVTMLDVGQGDCILLRSPSGRVSLVDTGGVFDDRFDLGERVLGPVLWDQGIRRLDRLILTHGHPDHVGAAPFLLQAFRVRELWEGPAPRRDAYWEGIDARLRAARVRRRTVFAGNETTWDGVRLRVLAPPRPVRAPWRTRNDDSLVVLAEFGQVRLLLTGDIEAPAEAALAPAEAAVLKVPHHGSRSSSTPGLLKGTSPRVALLSVGGRNRFGHPHPDVVDRYRIAGIRLFRTDRDGAVSVATDGEHIFATCAGGGCEARYR
jgi:competence protein ComEC